MKLILPASLETEIADAAKAAFPRECCGLIGGVAVPGGFSASRVHPARNLAAVSGRFEIDPADHIAASKSARANGQTIIGCYHSHPNGKAQPSSHDEAQAQAKDFLWLIAATDGAACQLAGFAYCAPGFEGIVLTCAVGADLVTSSS